MRNSLIQSGLFLLIVAIAQSAIIITSSLPQVYQINSRQALIVFDEPAGDTQIDEESLKEDKQLTDKGTISALLAAAELGKLAQRGFSNKEKQNIQTTNRNQSSENDSKKLKNNTTANHIPPTAQALSNSSSNTQQVKSSQALPIITSSVSKPSSSPPMITSTSNPTITASVQARPSNAAKSQSISIPQEILKLLNSSASTSTSTSYSSTTKTTFSSTTIVTNHGVVTTNRTINYIKMASSFGSLGSRADEEQYRNLVKSKNAKWISEQAHLSFKLAENQFTHLTIDQFRQLFLNLEIPKNVNLFDIDYQKDLEKFFNIDANAFDSIFGDYSPQKRKNSKQTITPSSTPIPTPTNFTNSTNAANSKTSNNSTSSNSNSTGNSTKTNSTSSNSSNTNSNNNTNTSSNNSNNTTSQNTTTSNTSSSSNAANNQTSNASNTTSSSIVISVDWTTSGAVSSIKDQGSCGGCYAFATNAAIESAYLMKNSTQYAQINLSIQQVLDCSKSYGNNGCNGGWISNVLDYGKANGITTEAAYPYTQTAGNCKVNGGAYKISSYAGGALTDCNALAAMVTGRPTSVAVSAGTNYWMAYAGGILNQCGTTLDHGVLLVGVFQNASMNYWKIKNSWGTGWGENGFIRIDRSLNNGNLCSICSYGYYPIV